MKTVLIITSLLAFAACTNNKTKTQSEIAKMQASLEANQKSMDASVENAMSAAKKAGADQQAANTKINDLMKSANEAYESTMDTTASGGQPGQVTLSGGFARESGAQDQRVAVKIATGQGWRNDSPKLREGAFTLLPDPQAGISKVLRTLDGDKRFVNIGCDLKQYKNEIVGLEEVAPSTNEEKTLTIIEGGSVFICDASLLTSKMILIQADNVILNSVNLSMVGTSATSLTISSRGLTLNGSNFISTLGAHPMLEGPAITLTTFVITGDGDLSISARGASYTPAH